MRTATDDDDAGAGVSPAEPSPRPGHAAPLVSVVVPAYQVTPFIADTLDSVFRQTFTDYEVIVVNDGCPDTDGLERVLAPYRHRIRYTVKPNGGLSSARNEGIRIARGSLIALLDGDDQWLPDFLLRQTTYLAAHPDVDAVCSDAVFFGDQDEGMRFMVKNPSRFPATLTGLLRQEVVVMVSATVIRREAMDRAGLFDEALRRCEDFDLWLRMTKQGSVIAGQGEVLARYRRRAGSLSSAEERMLTTTLAVLDKTARNLTLLPDEEQALADSRAQFSARLALHRARVALLAGDSATATREFDAAREVVQPLRWWLVRIGLRVAPGWLARIYRRSANTAS